jgi:hypothetical protein
MQRGAVERAVVLQQPRTIGLMTCASSGRVWPVRRCSRQDRTCALALCKASLLIAGRNDVKLRPFLPRALRARKV